jgi:hypothetical protein
LLPRLEQEDSALYKEFYGKVISRDSAIDIFLIEFKGRRKAIDDENASIQTMPSVPGNKYSLSPKELQYIYDLNNELKSTASRCFHSFHWGTYNVSPTDITTSPDKYHLSDKAKLTIIGTVVAIIIGSIIFFFESN